MSSTKERNAISLKKNNSFNVITLSPKVFSVKSIAELKCLPDLNDLNFYILGEGSNTLFTSDTAPVILKADFSGIEVVENDEDYIVTVGASENWHNLVCYCINMGINGLENLALIPGSVGAAPVQNIGAYGVEFSNYCLNVNFFDFTTKSDVLMSSEQCKFGYRDSIFKHGLHNKGIITAVTLKFPKQWQPKLSYSGLDRLDDNASAETVMNEVVKIRNSKLPDPALLPNAGSFFKNPIVSDEQFKELFSIYPNMPYYLQRNGGYKIAAGWLIEKAGLKGFRHKDVGVHINQALVLVNYGEGTGQDIVDLAKYVQSKVLRLFSILIVPEVRMISADGEVAFSELSTNDICDENVDE